MGEAKRKKEAQRQQPPRPPLKHAPADALVVLQAANAFRDCARPLCQKLGGLLPEAAVQAVDSDFGGTIASASNLAFAIELYMKALRMLNKLGPMNIHELSKLYLNLPKELRRAIETTYDAMPKISAPYKQPKAVLVRISHKNAPESDRRDTPRWPTDVSLHALLERNNNLFERWRYLWDEGEPGKVKQAYYEYQCLEAAADALREHTTRAINALVEAERGRPA
jgi:hypothetical protein